MFTSSSGSLAEAWSSMLTLSAAAVFALSFFAYAWDLAGRSARGQKRSLKAQGIAHALLWLAWALILVGVVLRGISLGRVPWGNMYEFATMGICAVVAVYLGFLLAKDIHFIGAFVTGFAVLVLLIASIFWYRPDAPLQPALQSYWLVIHVFVAILGTGFFTIAAGLSILQLMQAKRERDLAGDTGTAEKTSAATDVAGQRLDDPNAVVSEDAAASTAATTTAATTTAAATATVTATAGAAPADTAASNADNGGAKQTRLQRLLSSLPTSDWMETTAYRTTIIGFVFWTFTLIFGAIWAQKAWGRAWNWDVKEVWTFIIWVVYAGYLHARATRGWRGSPAAWLCLAGFLAILFNFGIVNVFFSGLHSYSGLK